LGIDRELYNDLNAKIAILALQDNDCYLKNSLKSLKSVISASIGLVQLLSLALKTGFCIVVD